MDNSSVINTTRDNSQSPDVRPKAATQAKVRRRNRMITSCLECRRRKLKCDKTDPCTNCTKFSRECTFLAPALDSASQQRLNDIKEKMGSLERVLEEDVAKRNRTVSSVKKNRKSSIDLPGEESSGDDTPPGEYEKDIEFTPLAVNDAAYEDDANDDMLDLGIRIGKMRMGERLGGFVRPKFSEELAIALENPQRDDRTDEERAAGGVPALADDPNDFLEPGATFINPGSGFVFGNTDGKRNLIDFLPNKEVADTLTEQYHENVHFVARVVHWPSFQLLYDNFWTTALSGYEPQPSAQAVVLAIMFSAIASMEESEVDRLFGRSKKSVQSTFQKGAEICLSKAQFLRTTKIETLQAFVIYLIPMCRDQLTRAHSVLVGTALRLAECMGLHRDPKDVYGFPPIDAHVRRILWFQLLFLDFRTGEGHGPRPAIRREDFDTKFPLNIDDADLMSGRVEESNTRFTDMTLARLRFECNEMQRIIWYDRMKLEKKTVSLTHVLGKIESFRKAMSTKYEPMFDKSVPIQHYASLVLSVLLNRMHTMVLHRYMNNVSKGLPDRLRQVVITTATQQLESAVALELQPGLERWRWYNGVHQQWHAAFLLVNEIYTHPNRKEADRLWKIFDYVFEPDTTLSRVQKGRSIIGAMMHRGATYRDIRRLRAPGSMRSDTVGEVWNIRKKRTAKEQIRPITASAQMPSNPVLEPQQQSRSPPSNFTDPNAIQNSSMNTSWTVDSMYTGFSGPPAPALGSANPVVNRAPSVPGLSYSSPSEHSGSDVNNWPPLISGDQFGWVPVQAMSSPHNTNMQISNSTGFSTATPGFQMPSYFAQNNMPPQQQQHPSRAMSSASTEDLNMPDIDWGEWDKIFPPDQNTGHLDISPSQ